MPHEPVTAQTFTVTVPAQEAARAVAAELAGRGHVLVAVREVDWALRDPDSWWFGKPSMRPGEQGHWDVSSVATGPLPDEDERWWQAQEDQAVRVIATRFGGKSGGSGGGHTDTVVRTFTRVGLVHELDEGVVRERRLAALASSPPRAGGPESSGTDDVDEDLPDGPGDPVALPAEWVAGVDWASLEHAYGDAGDVPAMLEALAGNDEAWDEHVDDLVGSVTHQGSSYSSTVPALEVVAVLAVAPQLSGKRRLGLLYLLFMAGAAWDQAMSYGYRPEVHHEQVRDAVVGMVPDLLGVWGEVSRAERRALLLLAALAGQDVPAHDLTDPASALAGALLRSEGEAGALLTELGTRHEDLVELAHGEAPLSSRVVAALEVLLLDG